MINTGIDSTEQKIRDTACQVFLEKGFKGTTIREVASRAVVNVALVNYYFRSKQKLFQSVFKEKLESWSVKGYNILLDETLTFEARINRYIDLFFSKLEEDPQLAIFIISESHYNADILSLLAELKRDPTTMLKIQTLLDKEHAEGKIRRVRIEHLEMSITSQLIYPFISKPIMIHTNICLKEGYEGYLSEWKEFVKQTVISSIALS